MIENHYIHQYTQPVYIYIYIIRLLRVIMFKCCYCCWWFDSTDDDYVNRTDGNGTHTFAVVIRGFSSDATGRDGFFNCIGVYWHSNSKCVAAAIVPW